MLDSKKLARRLRKIRRVFDVDAMLGQSVDERTIVDYYTQNSRYYGLIHSFEGSVHMALNPGGRFDRIGYYGQAEIVQRHVDEIRPRRVLELASGKGFNTRHLATQNTSVNFVGVDLTPPHVAVARRNSIDVPNLEFKVGDFQNLRFCAETFDLIFVVESLCHASDMVHALSEAYRVLKPGGRFIVIDGYRRPGFDCIDPDLRTAARLVEVAMAVPEAYEIDDWLLLARNVGFDVLSSEDLTRAIQPNLARFEFLARGFFRYPSLSRLLLRVLPMQMVVNAIPGLLMPITTQAGAQGYYVIALVKQATTSV